MKRTNHLSITVLNLPPASATTWLADATADAGMISDALDREVIDQTPDGHIRFEKSVEQHPVDITRGASERTVQGLMRGVLAAYRDQRRVGVICHQPHKSSIKQLGVPFSERICRVEYFGSGADRASNSWTGMCDLLIVAGTPRLQPREVQRRLAGIGHFVAADRDGQWGPVQWEGRTRAGKPRTVDGLGYQDPDWQRAHRSLVRAAIIQAVGRARAIRESGCDAIVLSNEETGLPLADPEDDVEIVTESEAKILNALIAGNSYIDSLGDSGDAPTVKTAEIAREIGLCESETRRLLVRLEARGLVVRRGQRVGWRLSPTGIELAPRPLNVMSNSDNS